jgi:hypothetical protein
MFIIDVLVLLLKKNKGRPEKHIVTYPTPKIRYAKEPPPFIHSWLQGLSKYYWFIYNVVLFSMLSFASIRLLLQAIALSMACSTLWL